MRAVTTKNIIIALAAIPLHSAIAESLPAINASISCSDQRCIFKGRSAFEPQLFQKTRDDTPSRSAAKSGSTISDVQILANRIGRVETQTLVPGPNSQSGISQATGILVSPCLMVTNQHVTFGGEESPDPSGNYPLIFFFGQDGATFRWQLHATPIYWPRKTAFGGKDFVIVRVDKCPGKMVGWLEASAQSEPALQGQNLTMVGILGVGISTLSPGGASRTLVLKHNCTSLGSIPENGTVIHSCASVPGLSGSALLDASGHLVAINRTARADGTSTAVLMAEVLRDPQARALISDDKRQFASKMLGTVSPEGRSPSADQTFQP